MEDRQRVFQEYYNLTDKQMLEIIELTFQPKKVFFNETFRNKVKSYGINISVMRMMLRYDRYAESRYIDDFFFKNDVNLGNMEVLDFGCGVGDYGVFLARKGAKATFYDFKIHTKFAEFRCKKENILCEKIIAPASHVPVYGDLRKKKYDLVIFGEILEHISDPFKILELFTEKGTKYIYTSSYPYKAKSAFEEKGHDINAFFQQEKCLKFLKKHYQSEVLIAKATMWCR